MRQSIAVLATLALAAGLAAAPAPAQDLPIKAPRSRIPTTTHQGGQTAKAQGGGAGQNAVRGVGCQRDSFGALVCDNGAAMPAGAFGTRAIKKPPVGVAAAGAGAPAAQARVPNPAAMIQPNIAEDGNLYGDPTLRSGTDGYGCRTDATGKLNCD